jgi:sec-independent protein translocase protein TatA
MGGSTASDKEGDMGIGLIQPMHLLLILVIVLVVFGAGKLSQVGGALGQSVKDFKETVNSDDEDEADAEQPAAVAPGKSRPPAAAERGPVQLLQREEI